MHQGRLLTTLGTVLLLDVLRVFLPSLITLFGQAGATSPELIGAYALVWFLAPFVFVGLARRVPPLGIALAAGALLAVGRVGLQFTQGGYPQLYLASALVGVGAVWLVCTAMATAADGRLTAHGMMVGVVAGTAASAVIHTALGTVDLVWRAGALAWAAVLVVALAFPVLAALVWRTAAAAAAPTRARAWLALGPLLFLAGLYTANPAVAQTVGATPYSAAALSVVAVLSVALAASPRRFTPNPLLPLAVLLAALTTLWLAPQLPNDVPGTLPAWTLAALLLGQLALATCAGWATAGTPEPDALVSPVRTGLLASVGLLLLVVLVFAFYAAYDLHVPNEYVPFAALAVLAAAILPRTRGAATVPDQRRTHQVIAVAAAVALAATVTAPLLRTSGADSGSASGSDTAELRVAAYNVRMGFGMDGRLSVAEQAEVLRELDADVIALSEVDRGWLLNGGHDGLSLLAGHLGMNAYWGPADGPFWGDALLTDLPVTEVRGYPLPDSGPTGAQALAVTMEWADAEVTVISTHLQPEGYDLGNPSARGQFDELLLLADQVRERTSAPVVVAGDLNFEPEEMRLAQSGLLDAFAEVRPFPTMVSGARSDQQIDHVLISEDLAPSDPANPDVPHSDHRPIAVTLTPAGQGRPGHTGEE